MDWMTSATLRNPNNLGNVLGRIQDQRRVDSEREKSEAVKQETAAAAFKIMQGVSSLPADQQADQKALFAVADNVFEQYPNANKEATLKLMFDAQNHSINMRNAKNQQTLFNQGQQDRVSEDQAAGIAMRIAGSDNPQTILDAIQKQGGVSNKTLFSGLNAGIGMRPKQPSPLDLAKTRKLNAEADRIASPQWDSQPLYKNGKTFTPRNQHEESAYIDMGWSREKPGENNTVTPESYQYRAAKLKHVSDYLKKVNELGDLSEQDLLKHKIKAETEFDANMQGWEKVSNPNTGQLGYMTERGIVDLYGRPVQSVSQPTPANSTKTSSQNTSPARGGGAGNSNLPSLADDKKFQSRIGDMLGQYGVNESSGIRSALKITKGNFNQEDKTITFAPKDQDHLRSVFSELDKSGIKFDATQNDDGSITVKIIENTPLVRVGA